METTETEVNQVPAPEPALILNFEAQSYLREAGKWANFLGILGFVACALILIASFTLGGIMAKMAEVSPGASSVMFAGMGGFVTVIYILIDVIYFFFSLYLYQFGSRIKKGIIYTDNMQVTNALAKLKSFFKLWGILTIIAMCLYALIIVIVIIVGVGASSMLHH